MSAVGGPGKKDENTLSKAKPFTFSKASMSIKDDKQQPTQNLDPNLSQQPFKPSAQFTIEQVKSLNLSFLDTGRLNQHSVSIQEPGPSTRRKIEQTFPNFFKDKRFSSAVEQVNTDRT